ncbi:imidazolonepropionase [Cruoricaptor ignavus]|uniref:Imidazolonepropionase n=1 Tax=Cruoricaptor ignavus TaxID=1118202 RepID=A0A7M1T6Y8_9FLAO|nr:imidazolonepropionase [Cruoricaptor ignavus]QOR74743.1 imidazolonepropionase [Cruoricaptor ignavus]
MTLYGPFTQVVTMDKLPLRGALCDEQLEIIPNAGILVDDDGFIAEVSDFETLQSQKPKSVFQQQSAIALPAFVDPHTHICFGGSRASDFAMRNAGKTYLEIAENGGGIWSSVSHTRDASEKQLLDGMLQRIGELISQGITTIEVKSGYGLNAENELKMLRVIQEAQKHTPAKLVPTCLAAHTVPKDFSGTSHDYLDYILADILPIIKSENLARRVDIFIEKSAFGIDESREFLLKAKEMDFELTVHADQFTSGSSRVAVEVGACSADHLEATSEEDIDFLAKSETVATALPGASLGLGEKFTPARKLLDAGAILAIGTDWNPGSAPMGSLVTQASVLATYQKLTTAEVLSAMTFRSAKALNLSDRGVLAQGKRADFQIYETDNFLDVLYRQGMLRPAKVVIGGEVIETLEGKNQDLAI